MDHTYPASAQPVGQPRGVGFGILVFVITFGFYGWYWAYKTQEEMKQHTGDGLGGIVGLVVWGSSSPRSADSSFRRRWGTCTPGTVATSR